MTPTEPYYVRENANVHGIGYHAPTGLFIVTVARAKKGVPSTVNAFCAEKYKKGTNNPKVWGFPSYKINELLPEYFDSKRRSIRSADIKNKDELEKEMTEEKEKVEVTKVEKPEFEVNEKDKVLESDKPQDIEKDVTKSNSEDKENFKDDGTHNKNNIALNADEKDVNNIGLEEKDVNVEESIDNDDDESRKKWSYGNKHKDKDRNKNPVYHGSGHGHHTHAEKPNYSHGNYYNPDYSHGSHHGNKPSNSHYNKPHYSHVISKPHKNKYGTLSQIHTVHSHSHGHKEHYYVPLPYQEDKDKPTPTAPEPKYPNFISVFHPVVDNVCDRVWFIDSGVLGYVDGYKEISSPSIWVVDLPTKGKCGEGPYPVSHRYEIPSNVLPGGTYHGLFYVSLDYKKGGNCDDVFVYFPAVFTGRLNVYDFKNNKAWSFRDHYSFFPVISTSTFVQEDEKYTMNYGVFSITLGWRDARGYRTAYYISPTSTVEFGVSTEVLKQKDLAPLNYNSDDFKPIGNRGCETQAQIHVFDSKNGVIFYGDRHSLSLRCWNVRKPLTPDNVDVVYYDANLVYVHDIFVSIHETISN